MELALAWQCWTLPTWIQLPCLPAAKAVASEQESDFTCTIYGSSTAVFTLRLQGFVHLGLGLSQKWWNRCSEAVSVSGLSVLAVGTSRFDSSMSVLDTAWIGSSSPLRRLAAIWGVTRVLICPDLKHVKERERGPLKRHGMAESIAFIKLSVAMFAHLLVYFGLTLPQISASAFWANCNEAYRTACTAQQHAKNMKTYKASTCPKMRNFVHEAIRSQSQNARTP